MSNLNQNQLDISHICGLAAIDDATGEQLNGGMSEIPPASINSGQNNGVGGINSGQNNGVGGVNSGNGNGNGSINSGNNNGNGGINSGNGNGNGSINEGNDMGNGGINEGNGSVSFNPEALVRTLGENGIIIPDSLKSSLDSLGINF